MKQRNWHSRTAVLLLLACVGFATIAGCDRKEVRQAADEVAGEITGSRVIKQGEKMKKQIRQITKERTEQINAIQEE